MSEATPSRPPRRTENRRPNGRSLALAATLFLAAPAALPAADDETIIVPGATRAEAPEVAPAGSFASISWVLGLALAGAGGWMVWRNRRGTPGAREARALAIDEMRSLGNRQFLVVASYEGRKFLIGVCPGRIDMLAPLDGTAPAAGKLRE